MTQISTRLTYRMWTPKEVQKLEDLAGVYNTTTIAKKLKRSPDSIRKKMQRLSLDTESSQNQKGMSPNEFSRIFGIPAVNVLYWVRVGILPSMKLPWFMKIGSKNPDWVLIDDTKIFDWLSKGYVYHRDIKPTDVYYSNMVRDVRKKLDIEWISGPDVVECLRVTPKTIQAWYYRHKFPRLVFYSTQMSISMYNRNAVLDWCIAHPKQVRPSKIQELRNYGIGKGRS